MPGFLPLLEKMLNPLQNTLLKAHIYARVSVIIGKKILNPLQNTLLQKAHIYTRVSAIIGNNFKTSLPEYSSGTPS